MWNSVVEIIEGYALPGAGLYVVTKLLAVVCKVCVDWCGFSNVTFL